MEKTITRTPTSLAVAIVAATTLGGAQGSLEFRHLYTFGGKLGIHPPRVLNRKFAKAALGEGEHPYGLVFPVGVTTDARNRVWITDSGTASVHVFDRESGGYSEIRRAGEYALQQPSGIARDAAGRIYIADAGSGAIFVFDEKGEFDRAMVKPGSGALEHPGALVLSAEGRTVFVADPPRNAVIALNREGEVDGTISLPEDLADPSALAVVNNQIYVLGARKYRVAGFSPAGHPRGALSWEGVQFPTAFTFDAGRRRFLVANPRWGIVQVFDEDGRNVGAFGGLGDGVDQMQRVDGLYADPQGLIYVIDSHHGKVLVFADSAQP